MLYPRKPIIRVVNYSKSGLDFRNERTPGVTVLVMTTSAKMELEIPQLRPVHRFLMN